jgi:uncharacterized protein YcnI
MRKMLIIVPAAVLVVVTALPALAHVTVQPDEAVVGSFARFAVRVPTERDDASTIKIELQLPPLAFVSFQDVPGWERSVEMVTLDEPLDAFGEELTEVVGTVTWAGGAIEPHEFQEFGFSAALPEEPTTLEFPAIQTYDSGEVVRWIGPVDSDEPAARVTTVDLGAEEGQGQLQVLADLNTGGSHDGEESEPAPGGEEGEESSLPLILGGLGAVLGAVALVVSLARRPTRRAA